eukprot:scaffold243185_cov14-Tisochrysis_lutea.AAC.1
MKSRRTDTTLQLASLLAKPCTAPQTLTKNPPADCRPRSGLTHNSHSGFHRGGYDCQPGWHARHDVCQQHTSCDQPLAAARAREVSMPGEAGACTTQVSSIAWKVGQAAACGESKSQHHSDHIQNLPSSTARSFVFWNSGSGLGRVSFLRRMLRWDRYGPCLWGSKFKVLGGVVFKSVQGSAHIL